MDKTSQGQSKGSKKPWLFKRGQSGNPGGMKKGAKQTLAKVKQGFLDSFEKTGGVEGLVEWASKQKNRGLYYKILASLLPKEVDIKVPDELLEKYKELTPDEINRQILEAAGKIGRVGGVKASAKKT